MAFYGRTYTLGSSDNHGLHAPVKKWDTNGGLPGKFTNESGFLSYFEFCQEEDTWTKEYDKVGQCPYAHKKNQWVGYEDAQSLKIKMDWMRANKYGGAMIWALDLDDYRGVCGDKDILFNTLYNGLENYTVRVPPAHELTTTKKPNEWWSPPPSSSTTTTSRPKTTRFTEPTTSSRKPAPSAPAGTTQSTTTASTAGGSTTSVSSWSTRKPSIEGGSEPPSSPDCPADSSGQLLSSFRPHPTDNSLYLWCINGKDLVLNCPPATEWNNIEKQCVAKVDEVKRLPSSSVASDYPPSSSQIGVVSRLYDDDESSVPNRFIEANLFQFNRIKSQPEDNINMGAPPQDLNLANEVIFVPRRHVFNFNEIDAFPLSSKIKSTHQEAMESY